MTVTITLMEIAALVVAVAFVAIAVAVVRTGAEIRRTTEDLRARSARLEPHLESVLIQADEELERLQQLTEHVDGVAIKADEMADSVTDTAVPLLNDIDRIRRSKRHVTAAVKGARAGVRAFRRIQDA